MPIDARRVPRRTTSFVGRSGDVAALIDALTAPPALVTLVGIGGAGKTRLACEVAEQLGARGMTVFFVPLARARGPADVAAAVASALEVAGDPNLDASSLIDRAAARLAAGPPSLLVLDE